MKLEQVKKLMYILCALALALIGISCLTKGVLQMASMGLGLLSLAAFVYVWFSKWRCPRCGHHLGRDVVNTLRCKNCGKSLHTK